VSAKAVYGNENWSTSITGTNKDFLRARDWPLVAGRNFLDSEERAGSAVCIVGQTIRKELFGAGDPIGENIRLNSISCEVIGLLEQKGQGSFGQDQDDTVLMPIRTVQRRFAGDDDVASIFLSAEDGVDTAKIKRDVTYLMRERRGISADEDDNFSVNDMAEMVSTMTTTTRVLTGLLAPSPP
jgi:putative ABC transport system permease protein